MKTTQKDIRNTNAVDITYWSTEELYKLSREEKGMNELAWSCGVYGCNAKLLQGRETGTLYKITTRSSAIWAI